MKKYTLIYAAPPILRKHHEKVKALGVSLEKFISIIGRMTGMYGASE
ncbi:hypothetical protein QB794_002289 [Salmonella enterica]|nr:hypothetical protein [Salmonella enterica]EKS4863236.1 hypothetical protein [Salmonella enterica]EKS4880572.1 hypothetical protein [Salmonella enterica]EKS4885031.1 hypothetical protein [Salmonella enterica]EKS5974625.1 hypothetical protein [Salmonella enterica]